MRRVLHAEGSRDEAENSYYQTVDLRLVRVPTSAAGWRVPSPFCG
jgi:hypothetical protein